MSPQQLSTAVENNFTKGLITEATGLNFPENAATEMDNCECTLIGDVLRRPGIDYEVNYNHQSIDRISKAVNTYKWNNVGGDGSTQVIVTQVGGALYFWGSSTATTVSPLSTKLLGNATISTFVATGGVFDDTQCCEFADGNGYLFVFHPSCDPAYISYASGVFTAAIITVQIRDFVGVQDGFSDSIRPSPASYSVRHAYNLINQGWTSGNPWSTTSISSVLAGTGSKAFTVAAGITGISGGQSVVVAGFVTGGFGRNQAATLTGTVTSYVGTTLTLNISYASGPGVGSSLTDWEMQASGGAYISTFASAVGVYPSNSDQWWRFKNASGAFDPSTTVANTSIGLGIAPRGHIVLSAFNQDRTAAAPEAGAIYPPVKTTVRPTNGTWFQGRIWYTGVSGSYSADSSGQSAYTWTENIYFSKVVNTPTDFGRCYQDNDPTSGELFDLLPTDGGVIVIQGCGAIYRLFPIQNGLLVLSANGVWFITGSQGIGFAANDYTITKLSNIQSISCSSYVDVMGLPYFWNEDGIYQVAPQQGGGLAVNPITVGTIATFYDNIPLSSKKKARGAYHPIDYVIQWIYKDTEATDTTDSFAYDRILNYNTYNKAFYPYSVDITYGSLNGINYVSGPGGSNTTPPAFKYFASNNSSSPTLMSFADLHDMNYVDWSSLTSSEYSSYFVTGYKIRGQAIRKFQPQYVQVWSNLGDQAGGYGIQGIWDYASNQGSGKYGSLENVETPTSAQFRTYKRRHKMRGHGYALQFKVTSLNDKPFDIIGWAIVDTINQGT